MSEKSILDKFDQIKPWKRGHERAPHKPLLILYAIGEYLNGKKEISFYEANPKLKKLILEFGPQRKIIKTEYPFVRLSNDSVWELNQPLPTNEDYSKSLLKEKNVAGKFTEIILEEFEQNPKVISAIVDLLLDKNFPISIHQDILMSVGIDLQTSVIPKKRDSKFRDKILKAYEYQCAVCGYNIRLGNTLIGLEAAHIKWHTHGGPDVEDNGIALCTMHHKLFDRGAFTLNDDYTFLVSDIAHGTHGFQEWLWNFHGQMIRKPQRNEYYAAPGNISWHVNEVFKGEYRSK